MKKLLSVVNQDFRRMRWLLFWVLVSQTVFTLIYDAVISFMANPPHEYFRIIVMTVISFTVPLVIYGKSGGFNGGKYPLRDLRLAPFNIEQGIVIVLLAASGQFIMITLNVPAYYIADLLGFQGAAHFIPTTVWDLIFGIFAIALVPTVFEEFLFRGIVLCTVERNSRIAAIAFSTFVFALFHMNIYNFVGYIFMGIMLCLVTIKTGSLYAAVLYHFVSNLTALLIGYFIWWFNGGYNEVIYLFAGAISAFIISIILFRSVTPKITNNGRRIGEFYANVFSIPIILCIIIAVYFQFITK